MKNSSAFETSPNSGGGQVHVFTSFPEAHVDDDSENNVNLIILSHLFLLVTLFSTSILLPQYNIILLF
jgi:hypothetical protein